MPSVTDRPTIYATAPLRGPGLDILRSLGDVIEDSWISETTMRLYNAEQLAERITETGASIVICEADKCAGPVLETGLLAIASTRGDPTNVDIPGATAAGIPVLHAPGRNADAVAEMTVALLMAVNRHVLQADADVRTRRGLPRRHDPVPAVPRVAGRGPHGRSGRTRRGGTGDQVAARRSRHEGDRVPIRTPTTRSTRSTIWSPRPTSCRCMRWSRPRHSA